MEKIKILLTTASSYATVVGVGIAVATFFSERENLLGYLLFYILIMVLFVEAVWREIK